MASHITTPAVSSSTAVLSSRKMMQTCDEPGSGRCVAGSVLLMEFCSLQTEGDDWGGRCFENARNDRRAQPCRFENGVEQSHRITPHGDCAPHGIGIVAQAIIAKQCTTVHARHPEGADLR